MQNPVKFLQKTISNLITMIYFIGGKQDFNVLI